MIRYLSAVNIVEVEVLTTLFFAVSEIMLNFVGDKR